MKSLWKDRDAKAFIARYKTAGEDLALRTYSARLIGQNPYLVLHGGGNTSVKTLAKNITGESIPVLCIKGSGWDLDTIEPAGHPAVKLGALKKLRRLAHLSDEAMANALRVNMLDSSGPNPSVETLLHAFLPHKFIDHSHADAILSLTNQTLAEKRVRDWADGRMAIVPYIMPGFALSQLAARLYESHPDVEGLILLKHGIFTFGETAQQSYERMIAWVSRAERAIAHSRPVRVIALATPDLSHSPAAGTVANILRGALAPGMIVRHRTSPAILRFVNNRQVARWSQQGPATPDHIIRTKATPLLLSAFEPAREAAFRKQVHQQLAQYGRRYQAYVRRQSTLKHRRPIPLDPLPRIILVPEMGLFSAAADAKAAAIALDIYEHTIGVIENAQRMGTYEALGKKTALPFSGKVVWISGAASGIGLAAAKAFAALGAHVFMTDREKAALVRAADSLKPRSRIGHAVCDVTDRRQIAASFRQCSVAFGGVDIVISNAGFAPAHAIKDCPEDLLRRSFEVNFFAHQFVAQAAVEIFERQSVGGVLLFNASKSAFNPGPGFGPYSLPKAGVIALMRQYAIELGSQGIRSNAVNADRVRTGLFSDGLLEKRAKARGLTVKEYLLGNLLGEEVVAEDVAQAFVFLAQARKTTGAVLPVDGGNAAAFPR